MAPRHRDESERPEVDKPDRPDHRKNDDLPHETEEDRERAADDGWPDPSEQAE
jgi:hypothetical protein